MIESKWVSWIAAALLVALTVGIFAMSLVAEPNQNDLVEPEYATKLFLNDMITIDISVDEQQWQTMLDNATDEQFIPCDVTIDGTTFESVGIRPKGNSSLTQVVGSDSDRYSFRLSFDEYIDGQTCFGLDQLVLNNAHSDYTMMKDYICYDLMRYMGVDAPLTTYANILVNGEQWGVYLAVELYNESFLNRVYGTTDGNLYNVKMSMGMGGKAPEISEEDREKFKEEFAARKEEQGDAAQTEKNRGGPGGGMPGGAGGGGDLVYQGDDASQYSSIFENAVEKSSDAAQKRMITAIEHLNTGEDLETYWDVDKALRYLAVHTFVVNLDSYSSSMQQNYYLYENNGRVTILPWDYNLAFGGFQSGSASASVNFPIDTPVSGVETSERPLINTLLSQPEYLERYHTYLREICEKYVNGGVLESTVAQVRHAIDKQVDSDPTKFCTTEQYQAATEALIQFCKLRAESVLGQINGTIPSTTDGQKEQAEALVTVDESLVRTMGTQGGGGHGGRREDGNTRPTLPDGAQAPPNGTDTATGNDSDTTQNSDTRPTLPDGAQAPPNGTDTATGNDSDTTQNSDTRPTPPDGAQAPSDGTGTAAGNDSDTTQNSDTRPTPPDGAQAPPDQGRGGPPDMPGHETQNISVQDFVPAIVGGAVFLLALLVAVLWKRKY